MFCYLTLPGMAHHLGLGRDDVPTFHQLLALTGGHWEGDRVLVSVDPDRAVEQCLDWVRLSVDGFGIAGVLGTSEGHEGTPTGLRGHRLRLASRYTREGELFVLPPVTLPEGVGRFELPGAIAQAIGGEAFRAFDARD